MPIQDLVNGGIGVFFMVKGAIDGSRRHRAIASAARELAGKVPSDVKPEADEYKRDPDYTEEETTAETEPPAKIEGLPTPKSDLPTTQDTVTELKRRLGKELYRLELDLIAGCKIMGKPCDCCGDKHQFGVEATAEELVPMDQNPIYREIISWYREHAPALTTEASASGNYDDQYPIFAKEIRKFRKRVMGTESVGATLTKEEKNEVKKRATEIIGGQEPSREV